MLSIMIAVVLSIHLASCSEHIEDWQGNVTTGSILLSDNSIVSSKGYDASRMTAVGVVYTA